MKPLFQVGEEVILQSIDHPAFNGECVITDAIGPVKWMDGDFGFAYYTTIQAPAGLPWSEKRLKKKHTPGDSFESIMSMHKVREGV